MPLVDVLKGAFTSGELSPRMLARQEVDRYKNGAILVENFRVLTQGGLIRREGTHFCAAAKFADKVTLVKAFEPSTTDAYILEFGDEYIRFYKNKAQIMNPLLPGVPAEITTPFVPYQDTDLRLLRTAQSNDVMILVHPNYAPRRLSRLSDTVWDLRPITFDPPPLFEAGVTPLVALTLSAVSGTAITITAASSIFLPADVQRQLVSGVGRALITGYTSGTSVTARVLDPFSSTSIASGSWTLRGSPVARALPSATGPVGATITITLQADQSTAPELVTNGTNPTTLAGWTSYASATLLAGPHNGPNASSALVDNVQNFLTAGIRPGHLVINIDDVSTSSVGVVTSNTIFLAAPLQGGAENDFDTGDDYRIDNTGSVAVQDGTFVLVGGPAGVGWMEQGIATVIGTTYLIKANITDGAMAFQVGSAAKQSDVLAEASYPIGTMTASFTAVNTISYLQFRNNQPTPSRVNNISARRFNTDGFRLTESGTYVHINGGLVRVLDLNVSHIIGEVMEELSTVDPAAAGAWSLLSPAWSDALGWPELVMLYEGRLWFRSNRRFPNTRWGSAIDDLFNFFVNGLPDGAVQEDIVDSGGNITLNHAMWMMPAENLLEGTTHGEYRAVGSGDDPITAASPTKNRIQSTYGSAPLQPLKVGNAILFAQRQGSKIREMAFDDRSQTSFNARDITVTSSHLFARYRPIEFAYQQEPLSTVWVVRGDGQAVGLTYDQSEQVLAWWRMRTPGVIQSVATIPSATANGHETWFAIQRTIGTVPVCYIEYLDPETRMVLPEPVQMFNELTQETELVDGWDGLTMDCALTHSGAALSHFIAPALVGETVVIVGDGAVFPPQMMPVGGIDLPQAVSTCWIGLPYIPRGRTMPVEVPLRGTTHQGKQKRWVNLIARVRNTACLVLQGERIPFRQPHMPQNQGVAPFTGDREVTPLGWDGYGFVGFEVDQPLPCEIVGILGTVDAEAER